MLSNLPTVVKGALGPFVLSMVRRLRQRMDTEGPIAPGSPCHSEDLHPSRATRGPQPRRTSRRKQPRATSAGNPRGGLSRDEHHEGLVRQLRALQGPGAERLGPIAGLDCGGESGCRATSLSAPGTRYSTVAACPLVIPRLSACPPVIPRSPVVQSDEGSATSSGRHSPPGAITRELGRCASMRTTLARPVFDRACGQSDSAPV